MQFMFYYNLEIKYIESLNFMTPKGSSSNIPLFQSHKSKIINKRRLNTFQNESSPFKFLTQRKSSLKSLKYLKKNPFRNQSKIEDKMISLDLKLFKKKKRLNTDPNLKLSQKDSRLILRRESVKKSPIHDELQEMIQNMEKEKEEAMIWVKKLRDAFIELSDKMSSSYEFRKIFSEAIHNEFYNEQEIFKFFIGIDKKMKYPQTISPERLLDRLNSVKNGKR